MKNKISKTKKYLKIRCIRIKDYFVSKKFLILLSILLWWIIAVYLLLIPFASRIETMFTFPGKDINLKEISNHPAGLLVANEVSYFSDSGNIISGLYIDNNAEKTVYYFHGNGAPIQYFYSDIQYISDFWFNVIAFDFPGYGKSTGYPTQEENRKFAQKFYSEMQRQLWFTDKDLIIWWYSVGTALAIDFAENRDFDSLVLFSPFASRYEMSKKVFWFPIQKLFFLSNSYVSVEAIKNISEPTFIVHWNDDTVVPIEQGRRVYQNSLAEEKRFIEIDWFGHSLIIERYWDVLAWYIIDFFNWEQEVENEILLDTITATKILEDFQAKKQLMSYDIFSDDSLTKYVDPNISFNEKWYVPVDMRPLIRTHISDTKWNAQMREQAADAFEAMAEKFYEDKWEKIVVVSSYRSYSYQAGIKSRWCSDALCAKAGHSEHQSWLTADLWSASSEYKWKSSQRLMNYYSWLSAHAYKYGFHNTYQKGRDIDGYEVEPWHWRFLWEKLSGYLHENNMTFAEYYNLRIQ